MEEFWKDIPGYEGFYQVSNTGKIKSFIFYNGKLTSSRARLLKPLLTKSGYTRVRLTNKYGDRKYIYIHRIVLTTFVGKSPLQVNHINGIKTDNNLFNLEYVTRSENMKHAYQLGLEKPCDNGFRKSVIAIKGKDIKTFPSTRCMCREMKFDRRTAIRILSSKCDRMIKGYRIEYL